MEKEVVTTGVDDLLTYLKGKDRVALQDVAVVLNESPDTIQAWVDFLVEEKILGIEYKFTKPFIYLNHDEKQAKGHLIEGTAVSLEQIRREYAERARAKQIPEMKIRELWNTHVLEALASKKQYFFEQAGRRNVTDPESLWQGYRRDLITRCSAWK